MQLRVTANSIFHVLFSHSRSKYSLDGRDSSPGPWMRIMSSTPHATFKLFAERLRSLFFFNCFKTLSFLVLLQYNLTYPDTCSEILDSVLQKGFKTTTFRICSSLKYIYAIWECFQIFRYSVLSRENSVNSFYFTFLPYVLTLGICLSLECSSSLGGRKLKSFRCICLNRTL